MPTTATYPRLTATFRPQTWVNDYAINTGHNRTFDATEALLSLPLSRIRAFKENNYDSDYLAEDLPERQEHDGPFEVDVDISQWLEDNGIRNSRKCLTQEDLDMLRERHKAEEHSTFRVFVHDRRLVCYIVDAVDVDHARRLVEESDDADKEFGGTTKDSEWYVDHVDEA